MIGYLRGQPKRLGESELIIDVAGVGYEVHCSVNTLNEVADQTSLELWVHTHVREDALLLFGFASLKERELFLSLLKVSGIGPKTALNILSAGPLEQLIDWIETGDAKALSKLPKVGKKTAEQMVLSLKGKLALVETETKSKTRAPRGELVSALVNLGFRLADVEKVTSEIDATLPFEDGLRRALAALTN